jgi:hypothetical protein
MYCPNCSTESQVEQKFCRSCGMELTGVVELIRGQADIETADCKVSFFQRRHRAMLVLGTILMLAALLFGSSVKILSKEHIQIAGEFTPYLMVFNLLLLFVGMGLICLPFLLMMSSSPRAGKPVGKKAEATFKLDRHLLPEEPASVTEQTTEFLRASEAGVIATTAPQSH